MKEGKENITEFARRMRELAGLSEGNQNKSLKTINEGFEDYELEDRKERFGINPEADEIDQEDLEASSEYFDGLSEFETHEIHSNKIKDGSDDSLYNLNENIIIVLDFLKESDDKNTLGQ